MSDIERELESELRRILDPLAGSPIPARRARPTSATRSRALLGGAGAAVTMKVLTGAVAAAAAVTVAGAATTGSFNPGDWGQAVSQRVNDCKSDLSAGGHGIGGCVSEFASSHGQTVSNDARHQGNGNGAGADNAHGNNSNANDRAKDHVQPTPKGNSGSGPSGQSTHAPPPPHP